jgi:beta-lactamase regulating signal transducer with metallopeptidase domain
MQYLVNTTLIWLVSLLVFDLILRKESYHSYNRAYLLLTLALGIVLPLIPLHQEVVVTSLGSSPSISKAMVARNAVQQTGSYISATPLQQSTDWSAMLRLVYICGAVVMMFFMAKDMILLAKYFKGRRLQNGTWTIIETGKTHTPFSFLKYIFISSSHHYSQAELQMVLAHEKQHGRLLHFADVFLLEIIRIIFWFHPLVHVYRKRLLTIHEYQADAAIVGQRKQYSQFLIQQALLSSPPSLTHSLNRSPIKKRIVMLTHKSTFVAGFKRLVFLPLAIVCFVLFTSNAISNERKDNRVYYNGNEFELQYIKSFPTYAMDSPLYNLLAIGGMPDTIAAFNPRTRDIVKLSAVIDTFPVKMNGRLIYKVDELSSVDSTGYRHTTGFELKTYLLDQLASQLKDAPDGYYSIFDYLVLDDNGNVAYMQQPRTRNQDSEYQIIATGIERKIFNAVKNTNKKFTPVKREGKTEVMRVPGYFLEVLDHKVSIVERSKYGC